MKISIRDLMKMSIADIYKQEVYHVRFDDNKNVTFNNVEVGIMVIALNDMLIYPDIPITSEVSIKNYYDTDGFTDDTLRRLQTYIYYLVADRYNSLKDLDLLKRGGFKTLNDVYNEIGYRSLHAILSIDIIDLIEIADHPDIIEVMKLVKDELTVLSINKAYDTIGRVLREYPLTTTNKAVLMYRSKSISEKQLFQIIGPRGFVAETDGTIKSTPIHTGYLDGMDNLYTYALESRTATVALMQADSNIAQSEYFGRRMQMITMSTSTVHVDDCNSDELSAWKLKGKTTDTDGNVTYNGDIRNMVGKYYKFKPSDIGFRFITGNEEFPSDTTIYLRTVDGCKHPDKHGVCKTCFGRLHLNIPFHYNIGHLASTILSSKLTQKMLSAKHVIMSLFSAALTLEESYKGILTIEDNGFGLDWKRLSGYDEIECLIPMDQVNGIVNLTNKVNIDNIDTHTLSSISDVEFRLVRGNSEEVKHIVVAQDTTTAVLTKETLSYIVKAKNLSIRDNKYVINLKRWQTNKIMFEIPSTEYSHFDLMKQVKNVLLKRSVLKGGVSRDNVEGLIRTTFRLVNSKLDVNLAMVEVIVYNLTVQDLSTNNYDLSRNSPNKQLGSEANILGSRSLGARLGSGRIVKYIFSTTATKRNRPNHPLDFIYYKQHAIDNSNKRNAMYGNNIDHIFANRYAFLGK